MSRIDKVLVTVCLVGLFGCKVSPSGRFETTTITFAKHHAFIGNRGQKNPLPDDHQNWEEGREAFSHYCVACHGTDGQNAGVPFAERMSPPIPSLAAANVQSYTDGQLKWILDNGIWPSGMPASEGILSDDELWSIVIFLRHLPPAGSQAVPDIYMH